MTLRIQLPAGIFVLALALAGTARADNNPLPLRTNAQSDAQDGRGDTAAQTRSVSSDLPTSPAWRSGQDTQRPAVLDSTAKNNAMPQLKTEIQVRVGEGGDHDAKLPMAAKPAEQLSAQSSVVQKPQAKLPIKSEVLVRLGDLNEESGGPKIQGRVQQGAATASRAEALRNMPVKIEVQMQMQDASGGGDSL